MAIYVWRMDIAQHTTTCFECKWKAMQDVCVAATALAIVLATSISGAGHKCVVSKCSLKQVFQVI